MAETLRPAPERTWIGGQGIEHGNQRPGGELHGSVYTGRAGTDQEDNGKAEDAVELTALGNCFS